jgi:hypothetical protein
MRRRGRLGRALPALILWIAAGCETLVDGQLGVVTCQQQGAIGPPACPEGRACRSGQCVPDVLGAACVTGADCAYDEFCLDPARLGGAGPQRCVRTCCTSPDCDPDPSAVCWVPPDGGSAFCRPAVEVGRGPPGSLGPLATCTTSTECRSGRCADHVCADTCCTDSPCAASNGTCRAGGPPLGDAEGFWCSLRSGASSPRYAVCTTDADCASGLCLDFGQKNPLCSSPCCSSDDCEDLDGMPVRCVMLTGVHAGERACLTQGAGSAAVGDSCDPTVMPSPCRGGMCLSLDGRTQCTDLCCSDASCGGGSVCRPAIVDGAWALRCAPK